MQNAPIEKFTALTETTFVTISVLISQGTKFDPDPKKKAVITKLFAPKFCAECTDREIPSSDGDHFRDHFYVYVSGPKI